VLFVAAISEYDQCLLEAPDVNRMTEALTLFEEIVNSRWFRKSSMILFLNKRDLFQKKIANVPLTICPEFDDYDGSQEYDECVSYIADKFEEKLDRTRCPKNFRIFTHVTTATDTNTMRAIFNGVKQTIIDKCLADADLL